MKFAMSVFGCNWSVILGHNKNIKSKFWTISAPMVEIKRTSQTFKCLNERQTTTIASDQKAKETPEEIENLQVKSNFQRNELSS